MWTRDFNQTGSRITLLVGQFIVLMLCVAYIDYVYRFNILPDKRVSETFQQVNCTITSKRLDTTGRLIHKFRADFLISYNVNGMQYDRWVSGNGLDYAFTSNQREQEDLLAQYDIGAVYPCYYDPSNPQVSLLVLRHNWLSTLPLMVPSIVGLVIGYYFFKNLFQLTGGASIKIRERRREKKKKKQL